MKALVPNNSVITYLPFLGELKALLQANRERYEVVHHKHFSEYPAWCYQTPHNRRFMGGYLAREAIFNLIGIPFKTEIDEYHQESFLCMYVHKDLRTYTDQIIDAYNAYVNSHPGVDVSSAWREGLCSYSQPGTGTNYQRNKKD